MIKILELHYLGQCRIQAGFDQRVAFGHDGTGWSIIIPETVLFEYFTGMEATLAASTLYGILGVERNATHEEITRAFRVIVKRWHPDLSKLYDSTSSGNQFIKIKEAYDILTNPITRARYDAGLALEASLKKSQRETLPIPQGYRAPKRSGYVLAEGEENPHGKFIVNTILAWDDITNERGQLLVTRWPQGAQKYEESWV